MLLHLFCSIFPEKHFLLQSTDLKWSDLASMAHRNIFFFNICRLFDNLAGRTDPVLTAC